MQPNTFGNNENYQEQRNDFRLAIIAPLGSGSSMLAKKLAHEAAMAGLTLRTMSFRDPEYREIGAHGSSTSVPIDSPEVMHHWNSPARVVHVDMEGIPVSEGRFGDISKFNCGFPAVIVVDDSGSGILPGVELPSCGGGLLIRTFHNPESVPADMAPDGYLIKVGNTTSAGTWVFRYSPDCRAHKTADAFRIDRIVNQVLGRQSLDLDETVFKGRVDLSNAQWPHWPKWTQRRYMAP